MWCLNYMYNYIDKDNNGNISKDEIQRQVYEPILKLINKINKKRNK